MEDEQTMVDFLGMEGKKIKNPYLEENRETVVSAVYHVSDDEEKDEVIAEKMY